MAASYADYYWLSCIVAFTQPFFEAKTRKCNKWDVYYFRQFISMQAKGKGELLKRAGITWRHSENSTFVTD
jgi:hypothetical protein